MKAKVFFMVALALMSCLWVGCNKKNSSKTELDGTKWQGKLEIVGITVDLSFVDNECYLTSNIPGAAAEGTYTTDGSQVYITVTNITGDWGGNIKSGYVLSGTYSLSDKTMVFKFVIEGRPITITFYQK